MNLLLVTSSFPSGPNDSRNAGVFVRDLAEQLADGGHRVTVLTPQAVSEARAGYEIERIPWIGDEASLTHLDPRHPTDLIRLLSVVVSGAWRAREVRRRLRPDRVIALWAIPAGLLARFATIGTDTPYDVWALGSDIWRAGDYPAGVAIVSRVLRRADRLFADGTELARDVERLAGRGCVFAPSSRRLPDPAGSPPVPHPLAGPFRLLAVGRFHEHKGFDVLLDAISMLDDSVRRRITVDVFGGGPDEAALRAVLDRAELADTVRIHGYIDPQGLADQLRATDLAVIPSRRESIPLILHDYASTDTPMIVTDTGDMGSMVRDLDAGIVVPAGHAAPLSEAIAEAVGVGRAGTADGRAELASRLGLDTSIQQLVMTR